MSRAHVYARIFIVRGGAFENLLQHSRAGRAMSSLMKPLKEVAEGGFDVEVKSEETSSFFQMIVSYCGDISKKKIPSAAHQKAGRRKASFKCHSTYDDKLRGTTSLSTLVVKTTDTRREAEE